MPHPRHYSDEDTADMTAAAGVALYCIAERLAFALLREEEEIENR